VTSGLHRISGAILSGTFYIFFSTYLIAPLFGWHLDSATIIAAFGAWPTAAKIGTKAIIALPFTFHVANGIRFLILDTGSHFTREMIVRVGWVTIGVSIVSAVALAMVGNEETK
jgi:succinate dehydrogenase (ubiquinone) cytochrome b560 subunit